MGPRIAYFVHDVNDAAVARRIAALSAAGARVALAGFRRRNERPASVNGAPVTDLGLTADARLAQRALAVGRHLALPRRAGAFAQGADVVVARNLETLAIAARVRKPGQRLVYECLDIHRVMLGKGRPSRIMRGIERSLLGGCDLLLTSSPAFVDHYFGPMQHWHGPTLISENKALFIDEVLAPVPASPPGPPWKIGWFGMLRCRKSLAMLSEIVRRSDGRIEVTLAGRPAYTEFEDFDRDVAATPGLRYIGPYTHADLAALYGGIHFSWTVDFFEEGLNSSWLLPNRLYEGVAYGAVPIALDSVEIANWLRREGVGVLFDDLASEVPAFLDMLDSEGWRRLQDAVLRVPPAHVRADRAEVEALARTIAGGTQ
jgi:succinoglycan biosynthesis protein ExoL